MASLYLDRRHSRLTVESQSLVVYFDEVRQRPIPISLLERVVLLVNVELNTGVLVALAEAGVMVQFSSARQPQRRAVLLGAGHKNATLRVLQYRCYQDAAWRQAFACQLMAAKLQGQHRLVSTMLMQRPDKRKVLRASHQQIEAIQQQLSNASSGSLTTAQLLGLEGSAARAFFAAMAAVMPACLGFNGRKRRPPPDAVNASLSLAYTLLHGRAVHVLHTHGLDPLIGFYHEISWGRESLAADLIEPWRPRIDEWVWEMFREQRLRAHHFTARDGGMYLNKEGRQRFFASLEPVLRVLLRAMRWQVRDLLKRIEQQGGEHEQHRQ